METQWRVSFIIHGCLAIRPPPDCLSVCRVLSLLAAIVSDQVLSFPSDAKTCVGDMPAAGCALSFLVIFMVVF